MTTRITRDEMFIRMAEIVACRSTCSRAQVGAVLVQHNRAIAIGYAGAPSGMPHCIDVGCDTHYIEKDDREHCFRTVHAEANVIAFSAKEGIKTNGATLYCTHKPCENCAKLLINAGIVKVVYLNDYGSHDGLSLLQAAGVKTLCYSEALLEEN